MSLVMVSDILIAFLYPFNKVKESLTRYVKMLKKILFG